MINKQNDTKYIFVQVVLTLAIAFIPIYFYLDASVENQRIKDKIGLQNYSDSVFKRIKNFEQENNDIFYYPRSNIYRSGIFKNSDKNIFATLKESELLTFDTNFMEYENSICYKRYFPPNILNAAYVTVCKDINNTQIIYNVLILLLSITCLIFLSSFFIIKQSTEPYKKLNKYLDNFIKDAMHELKTPLGVARINLDMLAMKTDHNKYTSRINSALKNMTLVYEDLEYYIQRKLPHRQKKDIDLSSFLTRRIEFFKDLADAKNIKIITDIDDNVDIYFDEMELYRLVDNNLSNSIKYSKTDTLISISLKITKEYFVLTFKDKGVGIKDKSRIFNRYYRGDKISGGFGIGLSIVKKICDDNGVKIRVNSKVNRGSSFRYFFVK